MKVIQRFITASIILACAVVLAACGGGGSSGGAGGGGETTLERVPYMGTYQGTFSLTMSAHGVTTPPAFGVTTIVVNSDNSVVVDPGPYQFLGSFDPATRQMLASFTGASVNPGCTGNIVLVGNYVYEPTVPTHAFNGQVVGDKFTCRGTPFTVSGNFQTSKVNDISFSRSGPGIRKAFTENLR